MADRSLTERFFPFYRFNLERNPFGTLNDEERVAVTVLPAPVEQALARADTHLQVLGRKGRGKSTTLHYLVWQARLCRRPVAYERLPRWQWRYHTPTDGLAVFALDEGQRLAPWEEARLLLEQRRHGWRLLLGSHRDHRLAFALAGLDVVTVRVGRQMTHERLAQILSRRLAVFARDADGPGVSFSVEAVDYLYNRFGSDLRTMNHALYDYFQDVLQTPGTITREELSGYLQDA